MAVASSSGSVRVRPGCRACIWARSMRQISIGSWPLTRAARTRIRGIFCGHAKACSLRPHSTPHAAHSLEMRFQSLPAVGSDVTTKPHCVFCVQRRPVAYRTGVTGRIRLVWMDRSGRVVRALGPPDENILLYPEPSPDGQRIVVQRTVQGNMDIWQIDAARGIPSRVTIDANVDSTAVWSPDGNRLIFRSNRNGVYDLYRSRRTVRRRAAPVRIIRRQDSFGLVHRWSRPPVCQRKCEDWPGPLGAANRAQGVGTPFPSSGRASPKTRDSSHPMGDGLCTGPTSQDWTRSEKTYRRFRGRAARRGYRRKAAANRVGGATVRSCSSSRRTTH